MQEKCLITSVVLVALFVLAYVVTLQFSDMTVLPSLLDKAVLV